MEATHLVPPTRLDVHITICVQNKDAKAHDVAQIYEEVLGRNYLRSAYYTSYGVLLQQKLRSLYNKRLLAFYVQVSVGQPK